MVQELKSPKFMAAHTGWPVSRIRSLVASNKLRHIRIGGNILIPEDAVDEYLSTNMVEPEISSPRAI